MVKNKRRAALEYANEKYIINKNGDVFGPRGKKLKLLKDPCTGYLEFKVRCCGKICSVRVHRFQAYKKFGNKIFKYHIDVRHLNGNKVDNSWDNIEIGTRSQNRFDISKENRIKYAGRKLTNSEVLQIRSAINSSLSYKELAFLYSCSESTIGRIVRGETYSEV